MQLIFADDHHRENLQPFVFIRPVAEIRIGILTIRQKWELALHADVLKSGYLTVKYLKEKFPFNALESDHIVVINSSFLPSKELIIAIQSLQINQQLCSDGKLIAAKLIAKDLVGVELLEKFSSIEVVNFKEVTQMLENVPDIFRLNDYALRFDFDLLTEGRFSAKISTTNQVRNPERIFLEEGVTVENCILNADTGPIYIGAGAEVMEGCMIRGPFSLGQQAILKMGTKIYGATTIGPGCRAGGEINNSVLFANSNKAHDGYLGNSVVGEWCNLGADTNNSNLKNNYGEIKIWNYAKQDFLNTGLQFCGLFMGDHSKCAINTSFNTGTVMGIAANVFMHGFPPKYITSFCWGGGDDSELFLHDKMLQLAEIVMKRRQVELTTADRDILSHLYQLQLQTNSSD